MRVDQAAQPFNRNLACAAALDGFGRTKAFGNLPLLRSHLQPSSTHFCWAGSDTAAHLPLESVTCLTTTASLIAHVVTEPSWQHDMYVRPNMWIVGLCSCGLYHLLPNF